MGSKFSLMLFFVANTVSFITYSMEKEKQKEKSTPFLKKHCSYDVDLHNFGINSLPQIKPKIFNLVKNFDAHGNNITSIPKNYFKHASILSMLYLSKNRLTTLDNLKTFPGLEKLFMLSLENNQIKTITPGVFTPLAKLWKLYLNNNKLKRIPPYLLKGLTNLRHLFLSNNNIKDIDPNGLSNAKNLVRLDLSGNKLECLNDNSFSELENLQSLNLSNNLLKPETLDSSIFSDLIELDHLTLTGNPLTKKSIKELRKNLPKVRVNFESDQNSGCLCCFEKIINLFH